MQAIETARGTMGTAAACDALAVSRASVYRQRQPIREIRHGVIEAAEQENFQNFRIIAMRR